MNVAYSAMLLIPISTGPIVARTLMQLGFRVVADIQDRRKLKRHGIAPRARHIGLEPRDD